MIASQGFPSEQPFPSQLFQPLVMKLTSNHLLRMILVGTEMKFL